MSYNKRATKARIPKQINPSEDNDLAPLAFFKKQQLQERLKFNDIEYDDNALKHELSAMWALATLGVLYTPENDINEPLVETVMDWCKSTVTRDILQEVVDERSMDVTGTYWELVKALILDEVEQPQGSMVEEKVEKHLEEKKKKPSRERLALADLPDTRRVTRSMTAEKRKAEVDAEAAEKLAASKEADNKHDRYVAESSKMKSTETAKTKADKKKNDKIAGPAKAKEASEDSLSSEDASDNDSMMAAPKKRIIQMAPDVLSLLLKLLYTESEKADTLKGLPECHVKTVATFQKQLNDLRAIISPTKLNVLSWREKKLVDWVDETYGSLLVPALGDLVIPGFDQSVKQFVVKTPRPEINNDFKVELDKAGGQSKVLFHGTPMSNLLPILHTRLEVMSKDSNAIYTAEEPQFCLPYAFEKAGSAPTTYLKPFFKDCGIILGLEVTGDSDFVNSKESVHAFDDPDRIMVRYVFVLPDDAAQNQSLLPPRSIVEAAMVKAFDLIKGGI